MSKYYIVKAWFIVKAKNDEEAETKAKDVFAEYSDDEFKLEIAEGPFKTFKAAAEALEALYLEGD